MPAKRVLVLPGSYPGLRLTLFGQEVPGGAPTPTREQLEDIAREIERETGIDPLEKLALKITEKLASFNLVKTVVVESLLGEGGVPTLPDPFLRVEAQRVEAQAIAEFFRRIQFPAALQLYLLARGIVLLPVAFRDP